MAGADTLALRKFRQQFNKTINVKNREIEKMIDEDAQTLKKDIEKSFEKYKDTPLNGYRLTGCGSKKTNAVWETNNDYQWQKPLVTISKQRDGIYVTASGKDVLPLEYGSGIDGDMPEVDEKNPYWIYSSEQGKLEAKNERGGGNWYRKIEELTGNTDPLISKGETGSRFFSLGNEPTYFVSEAVEEFRNKQQHNSTELRATRRGIAGYIKKELLKGIK